MLVNICQVLSDPLTEGAEIFWVQIWLWVLIFWLFNPVSATVDTGHEQNPFLSIRISKALVMVITILFIRAFVLGKAVVR